MKRFEIFGEYMFDLLFAPLKKGKRTVNQFYILFRVIGKVFDGLKEDALRVRDETNVVSASPVMLPVHGQDRDMYRLEGESIEAYRTRLAMKGIISEWSGVNRGILYTLAALGYEQSRIEPVSFHDSERWAEFIVFLGGKYPSGVNDLDIIDVEVRKVKEGSSRPEYGLEEWTIVEIREWSRIGFYDFPICGRLKCGQHPGKNNNVGYLLRSRTDIFSSGREGKFSFSLCGTTRAQEPPYVKGDILDGHLLKAALELRPAYHEGQFGYALSGTSQLSQGEDDGKAGSSQVETVQEYMVGSVSYPRSGQYRAGQRRKEVKP